MSTMLMSLYSVAGKLRKLREERVPICKELEMECSLENRVQYDCEVQTRKHMMAWNFGKYVDILISENLNASRLLHKPLWTS